MPDAKEPSSATTSSSSSTWHSRLGWDNDGGGRKEPMRKWVAMSLIALPTVALMIPGYRVYRMSRAAKLSNTTAPPVRTTKASRTIARPLTSTSLPSSPPSSRIPVKSSSANSSSPPRIRSSRISLSTSSSLAAKAKQPSVKQTVPVAEDELDAAALEAAKDPLYAAGAFGIATALVTLGLFGGVWGTRTLLGVETVDEFAARMRSLIRRHIPQLSEALYMNEDQHTLRGANADPLNGSLQWDASASETRLSNAFDRGGVEAWAECALREMEAERRLTVEAARNDKI